MTVPPRTQMSCSLDLGSAGASRPLPVGPSCASIVAVAEVRTNGRNVRAGRQALGSKLTGSRADLTLIQQLLDAGTVEREATYTLQALGLAFGKIFIQENPDYDWWMVQDEYGRDPAIRYKQSSLLAYPKTMISTRIEDGEPVEVTELFYGLCRKMEELVEKGWY
jgi:Domain of unknown function (DUF3806)